MPVIDECGRCGTTVTVRPYVRRKNKTGLVFCSRVCADRYRADLPREPKPNNAVCGACGVAFRKKPAELRPVNFCSYACARTKTNANLTPAPKGVRRSPATEFKPGSNGRALPVGHVSIVETHGSLRAMVKIAEPRVWRPRAQLVWEAAHGPIPPGYVVHHVNRDPLDDRLENLALLTRAEHAREHRHDEGRGH